MAAGDDFLKGDLYEAWLGALDKSIWMKILNRYFVNV